MVKLLGYYLKKFIEICVFEEFYTLQYLNIFRFVLPYTHVATKFYTGGANAYIPLKFCPIGFVLYLFL